MASVQSETATDAAKPVLRPCATAPLPEEYEHDETSGPGRRLSMGRTKTEDPKLFTRRVSLDYRVLMPEHLEVDVSKRYVLDKLVLGEGGYGKVFVARDRRAGNRLVAVKKVTKQKKKEHHPADKQLYEEIRLMKELDHPNICKLLETFERGRQLFIVLEFCEGGEVFERIVDSGSISEDLSAEVVAQVASALRYTHSRSIAHRDVKPENIVFSTKDPADHTVKLIDWGVGICFAGEVMHTIVGSLAYTAPEVVLCRNVEAYTAACDLWSLGVVTYVMLCGRPPFWGSPQQIAQAASAEVYPDLPEPVSTTAKDFVRCLLRADPRQRMTVEQTLQHPWLTAQERPSDTSSMTQVVRNLQQFTNHSVWVAFCITAVARLMDHTHLRDIHRVFREMDQNSDGVLSVNEVSAGFRRIFGEDSEECEQIEETFKCLDLDGSGVIDYTEFCAAGLGHHICCNDEVLWAAFETFDLNMDGSLSKDEIRKVLGDADVRKAWSADVCDTAVSQVMESFDVNHDGHIDFDEWVSVMQTCWHDKRTSQDEPEQDHGAAHGTFPWVYSSLACASGLQVGVPHASASDS